MPARWSIKPTLAAIAHRLAACWRTKLLLLVALWLAFGVPYLFVQRITLRPPVRFALTALDQWIGFHPAWVWIYQSAYALIPIAPLLSVRRAELWTYTRGFLLLTVAAMTVFLLFPVEGPRPGNGPRDGAYGMLMMYDNALNTFPSLHVGLVAHSLAFGGWLLERNADTPAKNRRAARLALTAGWLWAGLIAYSTLATKQHYLVDIPAGILLGWACQWWSSRRARVVPAVAQGSF